MIFGLFTTVLGKSPLGEKKSGQSESGHAAAVMEPPVAPSAPEAQPAPVTQAPAEVKACPQCGSTEPWGVSSWCPICFYHPRLGPPVVAPQHDPSHLLPGQSAQAESYLAAFKSIPQWALVLAIGVVSIFIASVWMSVKLPKVGYERAIWTIAQGSIGLIAAAAAHVIVFFKAIPNTDKYGPFDILLKPLDFWRYAMNKMPSGAWRLWMFGWGLTAAFSAFVMIGGVRYSVIFETKSKKKSTWYETSQVSPPERRSLSASNG